MKVAQILYSGLGGHGSVAFSLIHAAVSNGRWSPSLVFVGVEPVVREYEQACRQAGTPFESVQTRPGFAWRSWPALYSALGRLQPEAIVLHSVKTILPCAAYARHRRIPLIAVEHQANELKSWAEWCVSRVLMQLADAVVVLTPEYRQQLRQRMGSAWRDEKIAVVPNGIDTLAFSPPAPSHSDDAPCVIGMASRMTSIKRHDVLIDAVALLCARDGRHAWKLSLAGDGESLRALRDRVEVLGLADVVSFTGYLGEPELRDWFRTLDIYGHASAGETLSTSLLQAMAVGLPIVGSNVPGIANLLSLEGGIGLLAEQTPEAFASRLSQARSDKAGMSRMRRVARSVALREYSQLRMFERYQGLLGRMWRV